ncbi:MAG TPA: acetyl-CoA carboxylase biotin carboxylase subunit [Sulfurospirillum arcachonense]|nr:acetyl-CoA carboxylase biotin carboxylase subunit [Sulfurospirillum arcachonense]HIP45544.1 acetyl-CoA carboxylase biotin carboxylase subunit [Sulfurospirillum arcachonense]
MAIIEKILVANRGEIALRAIRTIKEMGKIAVAVYSKADKDALYLKYADASICIGEAASASSYLHIPSIISAAEISGCDAIFPGYGFLSENQSFVEICGHHGIKFIGPSADLMVMMSDKAKAKEVMKKAGVPVIEGSEGTLKDVSEAIKMAKKIGYPVIVKASAGGGGRGLRVVEKEEDLEVAYLSAESEALTAFGDGTLYMEKYIKDPRHIEVQVIGDSHGNAIHIGERDCSLQRRHQKLIEESPAIILDEKTRAQLHAVAVKAVKFLKYENAGTFEFLLDADKNFYFMEMNTRLQVEHCVSEMVSGIDIIELMIRVAEGEELPAQETIKLKGHSIECRITAEDPVKFIPSPGKITKYIAPGGRNVRVDSHVYQGYTVLPTYDSMIGKLIVWGEDRERAIAKMKNALSEYKIEGIKTVIDFHSKMMDNQDFIDNNFDTNYLSKY